MEFGKLNYIFHSPQLQLMSLAPRFLTIVMGGFVTWLWFYHRAQRQISGPNAWPIVSVLPNLLPNWSRLHDYLLQYFSTNIKTIYLPFPFGHTIIYIVDPLCVEHILKTQFVKYPKGVTQCEIAKELFGDGIFVSDGENWKEQQQVASYEFSSSTLRNLSTNVFREYALKLVLILIQKARDNVYFDIQVENDWFF